MDKITWAVLEEAMKAKHNNKRTIKKEEVAKDNAELRQAKEAITGEQRITATKETEETKRRNNK